MIKEVLSSLAMALGTDTLENSSVNDIPSPGTGNICYKVERASTTLIRCDALEVSPVDITTFEIISLSGGYHIIIEFVPNSTANDPLKGTDDLFRTGKSSIPFQEPRYNPLPKSAVLPKREDFKSRLRGEIQVQR